MESISRTLDELLRKLERTQQRQEEALNKTIAQIHELKAISPPAQLPLLDEKKTATKK